MDKAKVNTKDPRYIQVALLRLTLHILSICDVGPDKKQLPAKLNIFLRVKYKTNAVDVPARNRKKNPKVSMYPSVMHPKHPPMRCWSVRDREGQ